MEVTRKELRKNDILNRGLLGDVVSGDSAADQMEELQAQMGSPKTPQQNIALGEAYAKPRPFTPDARYYPNVGGQTFPSPAQAYMAEVAAARAAEEAKSGPGPTTDPYAALKAGLIAGEGTAQDRSQGNAISGLLGDINWKGLMDKLIQTFQQPEMLTPGVNALTSFGMSGAALNQAEIAGAKEKAKLDQANQQQALENEYRRTRDSRDAARLTLDEEKARADRLKAPTITKAKMEAFRALVSGDDTVRKIVEKLDGTRFGRFIGNSSSTDSIETAIAMEAITIQNNNSRISPLKAVQEAAKRLQAKASAAPSETKKDRFAPKN